MAHNTSSMISSIKRDNGYSSNSDMNGENELSEVLSKQNTRLESIVADENNSGNTNHQILVPNGGMASKVCNINEKLRTFINEHKSTVKYGCYTLISVIYLVYFCFAAVCECKSSEFKILIAITSVWFLWIGYSFLRVLPYKKTCQFDITNKIVCKTVMVWLNRNGSAINWVVLLLLYLSLCVYLVTDVFYLSQQTYNLVSLSGLAACLLFCYIFSYSPAHVQWSVVFWGIGLQFVFAMFILRSSYGYRIFDWLSQLIVDFLSHANAGAVFMFGESYTDHYFAFAILPVVVFSSSVISLLYYLGWMQLVVHSIGWCLQKCMAITQGEAFCSSANIFVGQIESSLMIQPLIPVMTKSELHTVMTCGFASISGSVLAGFVLLGVPANHLITASVMSAPAALAISKLFYPETEVSKAEISKDLRLLHTSKESNIIEAIAAGASQSIKLVANIAVNVIAFLALLEFCNSIMTWMGRRVCVDEQITFELICSYVFLPLALVLGVSYNDCGKVAELIGVKIFTNEFVAYKRLGLLLSNKEILTSHVSLNGSFDSVGNDIMLYNYIDNSGNMTNITLHNGVLTDRSEVITTYALCGFANISAMGVMLGGLGSLAEKRKSDLSSILVRALIAGNIACFMTAAISGVFYQGSHR